MSTNRKRKRGLFLAGALYAAAALLVLLTCCVREACAARWESLTLSDDVAGGLESLDKFCLLHDLSSADVLWANNCTVSDLAPGKVLYLPKSRTDVLSLWQHQGAWQPKALVKTTSAAVAERARGASGVPPVSASLRPTPPAPQATGTKPAPPPEGGKTSPVAPQGAPNKAPAPPSLKDAVAGRPAQDGKRETPATGKVTKDKNADGKDGSGKKQAKAAPLLLLSPDGDSGTGPMRLVISGDSVAIVRLPKSAAPRTPSMADLNRSFLFPTFPETPPSEDAHPSVGLRGKKMLWPVNGAVSSGFGKRGSRKHDGIDIPMPAGTVIRVAKDGVVARTGTNKTPCYSGYGNFVLVNHGNGLQTLYAHCQKVTVKVGQKLQEGQIIANVGRTGRATTNHLHFEVRVNGKPVNPVLYLR
ncbi:M23 family metallopeptidase [Fretibacterium fastidiosum]|uniref:Membrane proteins related to metalloendopeptidases n=1 Tax=Fretibacterium fastidiosum TaxID=651822 RepID=A0AB94IXD4_9BACT|nr:M23 family metallopeptidase [Fretibacterium fastidiosum]CBL28411.1 Membrane proteins related to metalloendopeptidases [Fretibacterium fastidiosum]